MAWWIWMLVGLGLLGIEALTPGVFFVMFFGIAAIIISGLVSVGWGGPPWFQFLLFSVLSIALIVALRERLLSMRGAPDEGDSAEFVGRAVLLETDIAPGEYGKGEARGSSWTVKNSGARARKKGESCLVAARQGLVLVIGDE
jgi:membrane protein implicated in regulation of membrane protease activity